MENIFNKQVPEMETALVAAAGDVATEFQFHTEGWINYISAEGGTMLLIGEMVMQRPDGSTYLLEVPNGIFYTSSNGMSISGNKAIVSRLPDNNIDRIMYIDAMINYGGKIWPAINTKMIYQESKIEAYIMLGGQIRGSHQSIPLTAGNHTCYVCDKNGVPYGNLSSSIEVSIVDGQGVSGSGQTLRVASGAAALVRITASYPTRPTCLVYIVDSGF